MDEAEFGQQHSEGAPPRQVEGGERPLKARPIEHLHLAQFVEEGAGVVQAVADRSAAVRHRLARAALAGPDREHAVVS